MEYKFKLTKEHLKDFKEENGFFEVGNLKVEVASIRDPKNPRKAINLQNSKVYVTPQECECIVLKSSYNKPFLRVKFYLKYNGEFRLSEYISSSAISDEFEINYAPTVNSMFYSEFTKKIQNIIENDYPEYFI